MVTIVIGNILSHLSPSQPTILTILISSVTIPANYGDNSYLNSHIGANYGENSIGNLRGLDVRIPPQSLPNSWSPPVLSLFDN